MSRIIPLTLLLLLLYNSPTADSERYARLEQMQNSIEKTSAILQECNEFLQHLTVEEYEATAYTHTGNKTYTGTWPSRGQIAVDPSRIPLGSRVYVQGYGWATATDTGGLIKGDIIDLFHESEDECWEWGRQKVMVIREQ